MKVDVDVVEGGNVMKEFDAGSMSVCCTVSRKRRLGRLLSDLNKKIGQRL
jgi:hypothetical protein